MKPYTFCIAMESALGKSYKVHCIGMPGMVGAGKPFDHRGTGGPVLCSLRRNALIQRT